MNTFIGVDLGWYGKPTGLASIALEDGELRLRSIARIEAVDEISDWIESEAGGGDAVAAIDAPLVIPNPTGIRGAERELNKDYRRFHAGCHAANLGRPFAPYVTAFSQRMERLGFRHGSSITPRQSGRFQIEVHPHAASVSLFGLDRIVKYKRGLRAHRAKELQRFRGLIQSRLPELDPPLRLKLPPLPRAGNLKPVEDQIDAVFCAYIACYWWFWGTARSTCYGSRTGGYIVVPDRPESDSLLHEQARQKSWFPSRARRSLKSTRNANQGWLTPGGSKK
jgi:predicted RNase H-like nuclease